MCRKRVFLWHCVKGETDVRGIEVVGLEDCFSVNENVYVERDDAL